MSTFGKVICLLCLTLGLAAQQKKPPAPSVHKDFEISGTVVSAVGGEPLAQARVAVGDNAKPNSVQAVFTDNDGRFLFKDLEPGKYTLVAERRGFPRQTFNGHEFFSSAIAVGPGKESNDIVFRLMPEGSVSGKVTDDQNEPVRNGQVILFKKVLEGGTRGVVQRSRTSLDDEGSYHFPHLSQGTYFVAVAAQPWYAQSRYRGTSNNVDGSSQPEPKEENDPLDVTYPLTYYQDASGPTGAVPITLRPGEHSVADIGLRAVPALHLRITNVNSDPSHPVQARLLQSVFGHSEDAPNMQSMNISPEVVEISGIAPGQYEMHLERFDQKNAKSSKLGHQTIDISKDGEVDAARSSPWATVTGTVQFEGSTKPPTQVAIQLRDERSDQSFASEISATGEFAPFEVREGRYQLFVPNPSGFIVKSISAVGAKVIGRTVQIRGAGPVQLAVVSSDGVGQVEGVVMRGEKPFAGAMVVLVPPDPAHNSPLFRRDQSDSDGTFTLGAVPPGKYTVMAIENGWEIEWAKPEVLRNYMPKGEIVQVESKGHYNVAVKLQ